MDGKTGRKSPRLLPEQTGVPRSYSNLVDMFASYQREK
jgi:hypothetical protein